MDDVASTPASLALSRRSSTVISRSALSLSPGVFGVSLLIDLLLVWSRKVDRQYVDGGVYLGALVRRGGTTATAPPKDDHGGGRVRWLSSRGTRDHGSHAPQCGCDGRAETRRARQCQTVWPRPGPGP